jgi:hypothetical protein
MKMRKTSTRGRGSPAVVRKLIKYKNEWMHVTYQNGDLQNREKIQQGDIDSLLRQAIARGYSVRTSKMPDVVQFYEIVEQSA